jgi:hypothetical protein
LEVHPLIPAQSIQLAFGAREKAFLPRLGTGHQSSKFFPVSLLPDCPGSNGENFHEEANVAILLCRPDGVKELEAVISIYTKVVPAHIAEGALEDEVIG